ncbi:isochorismatase family protein [Muricauda sp. JGD-17]|uniref:Isochorismatase family protein n=1 Tax=Flagellimonas ochracea TaxID=2696472 RepID=A0A964TBQ4_9FLAO|nr:cysteine hydrolase family protein [Allomuricauda ochracea]NAY91933.1 isochorismatase family protein [Allomuricauda ochracea]
MTALLLIDIQQGLQETEFYGTERTNPLAEENCQKILKVFRENSWPLFHIQHCSTNPESPLHPTKKSNAFHPLVQPLEGEPVITKNVNSAFIGTDLENHLNMQDISKLVIVGLTTEHCVSTSTRMAANLGFKVTLISDATAAFDKVGIDGNRIPAAVIHDIALANLKDEFATIKTTEAFLSEISN